MKRLTYLLPALGLPGCGGMDSVLTGGGWELLTIVLATIAIFIWRMIYANRGEQRELVTGMLWRAFIVLAAIVIVVIGFLLPDSVMRWLTR